MRDTVISNCEKQFVLQAIASERRLDGRAFDEFRNLELRFGSEYGCCYTSLGETKVLAQVTCGLSEPRQMRPNEGLLFINVDINETVCPSFDTGRQQHLVTRITRLLEKCIKESNCVDLESLCLSAAEQVFEIRVDVTVLNYNGNLLTCCSVAALAALSHFKTPVVTIEESEIIVHPSKEKAPIPLSLHHYPILVSFALFNDGEFTVVDPTELEEKVSEGELVVGMNNYRELCGLHFSGKAIGDTSVILSCTSRAALIAADCIKRLRELLDVDQKMREEKRGDSDGLTDCIVLDRFLSASRDRQAVRLPPQHFKAALNKVKEMEIDGQIIDSEMEETSSQPGNEDIISNDKNGGVVVNAVTASELTQEWQPSGGESQWDTTGAGSENSDDDVDYVKTITDEDRIIDKIELSGDSEEDEVIILTN